jgi:hypothetical protein
VDVEHPLAFVDAVDRAFIDAGLVLEVDARLGDHVRHGRFHLLRDPSATPGTYGGPF